MVVYTTRTEERYKCPKGLKAFVETFPSVQCEMSGCSGDIESKKRLEQECKGCEHYVANVIKRDQEELSRPVGRDAQ